MTLTWRIKLHERTDLVIVILQLCSLTKAITVSFTFYSLFDHACWSDPKIGYHASQTSYDNQLDPLFCYLWEEWSFCVYLSRILLISKIVSVPCKLVAFSIEKPRFGQSSASASTVNTVSVTTIHTVITDSINAGGTNAISPVTHCRH